MCGIDGWCKKLVGQTKPWALIKLMCWWVPFLFLAVPDLAFPSCHLIGWHLWGVCHYSLWPRLTVALAPCSPQPECCSSPAVPPTGLSTAEARHGGDPVRQLDVFKNISGNSKSLKFIFFQQACSSTSPTVEPSWSLCHCLCCSLTIFTDFNMILIKEFDTLNENSVMSVTFAYSAFRD